MIRNQESTPTIRMVAVLFLFISTVAIRDGYTGEMEWQLVLILASALLLLALATILGKKDINSRNVSTVSSLRYFSETIRTKIRRCFSKSDS